MADRNAATASAQAPGRRMNPASVAFGRAATGPASVSRQVAASARLNATAAASTATAAVWPR
ncbi:hypothetical protein LMG1860_06080 [Achromobacter denitrificans]|nr:hypothetical protein LMG1231_05568 [Achromobacter denitrificans]CAB3915314.1 hypothetical protein LMG1860_06080 [Achromobacter denitrificans]